MFQILANISIATASSTGSIHYRSPNRFEGDNFNISWPGRQSRSAPAGVAHIVLLQCHDHGRPRGLSSLQSQIILADTDVADGLQHSSFRL